MVAVARTVGEVVQPAVLITVAASVDSFVDFVAELTIGFHLTPSDFT